MTVPRPNRSLVERILYQLRTGTTGTVRGYGINASPSLTHDRIVSSRRGASGTPIGGRASKVDTFEILGTETATFTLTYVPINDSWNLMLNGARVHDSEFSILGKRLSIADVADLFLGADTQGSPWDLEIQYDYLAGVPTTPVDGVAPSAIATREKRDTGTTAGLGTSFPGAEIEAGRLLLLGIANTNGSTPGTPAGWTLVDTIDESSITYVSLNVTVFAKTSDGTETDVVSALGSLGAWEMIMLVYPAGCTVVDSAAVSAPDAVSLVSGSSAGPLAVEFIGGKTGGFKSGKDLSACPDLTYLDGHHIGSMGFRAGESSSALGGFTEFWAGETIGLMASIVVGVTS